MLDLLRTLCKACFCERRGAGQLAFLDAASQCRAQTLQSGRKPSGAPLCSPELRKSQEGILSVCCRFHLSARMTVFASLQVHALQDLPRAWREVPSIADVLGTAFIPVACCGSS